MASSGIGHKPGREVPAAWVNFFPELPTIPFAIRTAQQTTVLLQLYGNNYETAYDYVWMRFHKPNGWMDSPNNKRR